MATLSSQQNTVLKSYATTFSDLSTQPKLSDFLSMYFVCNILAEKLVEYKTSKKAEQLRVNSIKSAVKAFELQISNSIIDEIFYTKGKKKGNYSCRTLRNNYVHNMSKSDIDEIEARFDDLKNYMEQWINLFK